MAVEIKKINGVYMGSQEIASTRFASDANLVSYWKLEDLNDAKGINNLTNYGSVSFASSKFNNGAVTNGSSNFLYGAQFTTAITNWSISCWLKTSNLSQYCTPVYNGNSATNGFGFFQGNLANNGSGAYLKGLLGGVAFIETGWQFTDTTTFHHAVITRDTTTTRVYIDGLLTQISASTPNAPSGGQMYFGVQYGGAYYWGGTTDDCAVFSRSLTSDEIYSLYKTGVKKLNGVVNLNPELESTSLRGDANLVMYHRFEGNSTDETANNNDGSATGITYGASYGKMGQGISLTNDDTGTGASSYISIANSATLSPGTGNFSISLWYKTSDTRTANIHGIINKYNSSTTNNVYYIIEAATTGYITSFFRDADGDGVSMAATKSYKDGNWHHIVSVRNGTSGYLYIDGGLITSTTNALMGNIDTNSAGSYFWIGTFSANTTPAERIQSFTGSLDDLAVFKRALSATEISNLYNTNIKKYMGISNV